MPTLTMPVSGYTFEWSRDEYRALHPDGSNRHSGWITWGQRGTGASSQGEAHPGDRPDPTWWIAWGECKPDDVVTAWRADDLDIAVTRFEGLWIAEWVSTPQTFFWSVNSQVRRHVCRRPAYLPPPRYPFDRNTSNPRS